jgi:hypothetical protein
VPESQYRDNPEETINAVLDWLGKQCPLTSA